MSSNFKFALRSSGVLVLSALALACGGDDSSTPTPAADASTGGGGDAGTGGTVGETVQYNATLVTILGTSVADKIDVSHKVEAVDNVTGASFSPPLTTMTGAGTGTISLKVPKKPFALKVTGVGTGPDSTYDAVIVNNYPQLDPLVRISSSGTLTLAEGSGGFISAPDRAALGATIYWTPGGVRKGTVGCAKVQLDGSVTPDLTQDQRYNGKSGLPSTLDKQPQTLSSGRFYIANITKGTHKVKVTVDNGATFLGDENSISIPYTRSEASGETKAVIVETGIDIDTPTNPTPAGCVDPA